MDQERMTAIQNALIDLADKNFKALVFASLDEDNSIETIFGGSGADQTFLNSLLTAHIHRALVQNSELHRKE
jgi:hypothetical protein